MVSFAKLQQLQSNLPEEFLYGIECLLMSNYPEKKEVKNLQHLMRAAHQDKRTSVMLPDDWCEAFTADEC